MENIIRISSVEELDVVNDCVKIQAPPAALRIKGLLNEMTEIQEQSLDNDVDKLSIRSHFLIVLLVALLFAAALISETILSVSILCNELGHGNSRSERLPIQSKNGLGALSYSFYELLDRLKEKNKPIKKD